MAKIGEYRLRIFDLLYEKPICEYTVIAEKKEAEQCFDTWNRVDWQ